MFSLRARTSACLFLVVCLILTATATFNQVKHNEARIRSELGIVASRNADDIIERIYRLQYGLRDLNGMVMGAHVAGQLKLTGASVSQVFQPSLELNGATGYGFSDGHGRQAHLTPPSTSTPWMKLHPPPSQRSGAATKDKPPCVPRHCARPPH